MDETPGHAGAPWNYTAGWDARSHVARTTADLRGYPDLVVMLLGMRANRLRGYPTMLRFARRVHAAVKDKPEGLLRHERFLFSPRHVGMRQYWRDFDSLEAWASAPPHLSWWREYLRDTKGTGFWHETYFLRGGMESIYDGMRAPVGLQTFAPTEPAVGGMFSARRRIVRVAPAEEDRAAREGGS